MNQIEIETSSNYETLYYKGNIDLLDYDSIGVVGTRKPSKESVEWTKKEVAKLAQEKVIISGLALGIDKIAHQTAIDSNGFTIAILPSGFNNIYPLMHKKLVTDILKNDGLILTKYEPHKKANRYKFIQRDKLIAELSDELLVPQFKVKSGTMHTVRFARALNKNLYIQNADYEGNKSILKVYKNAFPL